MLNSNSNTINVRFLPAFICMILVAESAAQSCSAPLEAMTAKYWQYRNNLNHHFILLDRDSSGCVNDGIGQVGNSCDFQRAGYSLPATSIVQAPDGAWGMRDRNNPNTGDSIWYDPNCDNAGPFPGTHWKPDSVEPKIHNYLEVGSETPHQMGWYWVTLATEYELLRLNGQEEEMQRTLEELFLSLQAHRRLDMQAQCMARKRYDEITNDFEVETCGVSDWEIIEGDCLCSRKYRDSGHPHFDNPCEDNCDWQPDLSGYSGFFLREDATQELEILHDSSDDKYNIDLVSSDYAMSLAPPCDSNFSQPCYLVHRQNFMSHDGMSGLMIGLAMIKRYIPEDAEVTTCDGAKYKPLDMAKKISSAMIDRADDAFNNRISWPGSPGCCAKETFLSESEGGHLIATIHGFKHAADYIDDKDRHSNVDEAFCWALLHKQVQTSKNNNNKFWLRLKALGWDMGEEKNSIKTLFHSASETQNLEIMILINNLLYPGGDNLSTNQGFFEELLCKAPCGGPCIKQQGYGDSDPENWPEFDCPNEQEWIGQRWETHGTGGNRLFNGLDYMALHNIYRLHYGMPNKFYNPDHPDDYSALGYGRIDGPDVLCPVEAEKYTILNSLSASTVANAVWETSTNLEVLSTAQQDADIRANAALTPSFIQASFDEINPMLQGYYGESGWALDGDTVEDKCHFVYRKPISTTADNYGYESRVDHCLKEYEFRAIGLVTAGVDFHWKIELLGTSTVYEYSGAYVFLSGAGIFPVTQGAIRVSLTVTAGDCNEVEEPYIEALNCFGGGWGLRVSPNPAHDQVAVEIIPTEGGSAYNLTDPNGVRVRIMPQNGGVVLTDTRIYSNGENVGVSNLQNGIYLVEASEADLVTPVSTTLIIAR